MSKIKLIASVLVGVSMFGTAHAAQVIGASCADTSNGGFDANTTKEVLICANGHWLDVKSVPMASVSVEKYNTETKGLDARYSGDRFAGVRVVQQTSDGHGQFTIVSTVLGFNADNTAHVVIDLDDAGWKKHIDTNVPLDTATSIANDNRGAEYRVTVKRMPA